MAGSYNHVTTKSGRLCSSESFDGMIGNLGDAYEAVEEMYGMIWYLVRDATDPVAAVETARQQYQDGLRIARRVARQDAGR